MDRLEVLRLRLAASLDDNGRPRLGYAKRCWALRAEIQRLETERAGATRNPVESSPGT